MLVFFNSLINPLLYAWWHKGFRKAIKQKWKIIKTEPLKDAETRTEYMTKLTEKLEEIDREEANWNEIKEIITEVAEEKLGTKWVGGTKRKHSPWWSEELKNAVKDKTRKHRIWMKQRNELTRREYVEARNKVNKEKIKAKKNWWQEKGKELEEDIMKDRKKIYGLAKVYRKPKTGMTNIKNKQGQLQITAEEINNTWTEYFKDLLNVIQEEDNREREEGNQNAGLHEENHITEAELNYALQKMKNGKSQGSDGITIELIKCGGGLLKEIILWILNKIWTTGEIPEEWGKILIVPIYKGKGEKAMCKNYRGISLINHIVKIYCTRQS